MSNHYFENVYAVTYSIPFGKVTTYGAIADFLALGSARMVGWALTQSHRFAIDLPAHRVVNRLGELSGRVHFHTPTQMQELLELEGIKIENNKVVDFKIKFWQPNELSITL